MRRVASLYGARQNKMGIFCKRPGYVLNSQPATTQEAGMLDNVTPFPLYTHAPSRKVYPRRCRAGRARSTQGRRPRSHSRRRATRHWDFERGQPARWVYYRLLYSLI